MKAALEDMVNPEDFVRAVLSVLDERLHEAEESGGDSATVQRLLAVVAGVLPLPLRESARDLSTEHLDDDAARRATQGRASAAAPRTLIKTRYATMVRP